MLLKPALVLTAFLFVSILSFAQKDTIVRKIYTTAKTETTPHIDGVLDDACWKLVEAQSDFTQSSPLQSAPVRQKTEFRIIYDNTAVYIAGMMYDTAPDSIMKQMGIRDNYLTADQFRVVFDTYNTQQDAYDFTVTASGVQSDLRFSDMNYDGVWKSAVKILPNGWSVEMAIPYSALRFPSSEEQNWGLQVTRTLQRHQEFDQWCLTPRGAQNGQLYWGILKGMTGIKPPLRLSVTPYGTVIYENDGNAIGNPNSNSFSGGLDVKYGVNESFTLDATLLPDFSQVQSDNTVKNLGAFEQQYQDRRPFFLEGVDLFSRGDLFYSRRIGKTPTDFYSAPYLLNDDEKLEKNPTRSKLLNATKLSGRTANGLGLGILNAIVDNTYAVARDTITGAARNILTEPRSNYNIFVLDKQLVNGSSVYLINTNVIRSSGYSHGNVTGAGASVNNKKNTWNFSFDGAVSNLLQPVDSLRGQYNSQLGAKYSISLRKNSGKWNYGISRRAIGQNYDANDMGITFETNVASSNVFVAYNILKPWKFVNQGNLELSFNYNENILRGTRNGGGINFFTWVQFKKLNSTYIGFYISPFDELDYYEPRTPGRIYRRNEYYNLFGGYNSNQNNKVSYNINYYSGITGRISPTIPANPWGGASIYLNWRAGNRFTLAMGPGIHMDYGDRGWVHTEADETIVFGRRYIRNIDANMNASYVFMRDMTIGINARHYWATGEYLGFYVLEEDGNLKDYINYGGYHDFSFNSFNVDLVYRWIFAPGSTLSIAWKQNILTESPVIIDNYFNDFKQTVAAPQYNSVSVRVLYYLDYLYVKKALSRKKPVIKGK